MRGYVGEGEGLAIAEDGATGDDDGLGVESLPDPGTKFGYCHRSTNVASPIRTPTDDAKSAPLCGRATKASRVHASAITRANVAAAP